MNSLRRLTAVTVASCLLFLSPTRSCDTAGMSGDSHLNLRLELVEEHHSFAVLRASLTNTSADPIFVVSESAVANSNRSPAIHMSGSELSLLTVSHVLWRLRDGVLLYRDGSGVILIKLSPQETKTWNIKVNFPAVQTVPPYEAAGKKLPSVPCARVTGIRAEVGVFPAFPELSAIVARKKANLIGAAQQLNHKGRPLLLVETQQVISSNTVEIGCRGEP